jgi:hypothetical protein
MSLHNDFKCLRNWTLGIFFFWLCYATINDSYLRDAIEKERHEINDIKYNTSELKTSLTLLTINSDPEVTEMRFKKIFDDLDALEKQLKNHTHNYGTGLINELHTAPISN